MTRFALPVRAESRSAFGITTVCGEPETRAAADYAICRAAGKTVPIAAGMDTALQPVPVFHPALCRFERGSIRVETAAENHMGENRFYTEPARRCGNRQSCRPGTILPTSAHRPARRHARPAIVQISDFPRHAYRNR